MATANIPTGQQPGPRTGYAAVVLSGGTGRRLGGTDKALLELDGATLLGRALAAVAGADEVVVVGPSAATAYPVGFVLEDPPGGGPAAGLLAVMTTGDPSEKTWRSDLLDLESGSLRPIGEGLFPEGWPSLAPGSIGTQLFLQKKGGLVRIDPMTGRQHAILHPES